MQTSFFLTILGVLTPLLIPFLSSFNYYWDYLENIWKNDASAEIYDFVVVGSGSSGAVVAYRLAQHYKVLLLEAGGDPIFLNNIPGLALDLLGYNDHDWNYTSVPQKNVALSHRNQQFRHNRGKVMGGSSTLNYMLYVRGNPNDYNNWANITGDQSWNYENVLPYFKKSIKAYRGEFQENKKHYEASPYGFLSVEKMNWKRLYQNLMDAGKELGFRSNIDTNGPQKSGFAGIEVTQYEGKRHSTHTSILEGSSSIKNLRISKYSQATKVKLDGNGVARGVYYYRHGKKHFVAASKEVILSAGSYDSPKLLMLSGIGPRKELNSIGIKAKVDLPVGKNLQDHFGPIVTPFTTKDGTSFFIERDLGVGDFYEYFMKGTGALTAPSAMTGQFFYTSSNVKGVDWPDVQSFMVPLASSKAMADGFLRAMSLKKEYYDEVVGPAYGRDGFVMFQLLVRPKSKGEVTLKDKNPFSDPLIDPRPFTHPDDMKAIIQAINVSLKLAEETKSFREVEAKFAGPHFSHCKTHKFRSDAYWDCYTRHSLIHVWHPVGTCKMSHKNDKEAVVDSQLRVLGTRSLRVVDCSIMPTIVNGNTNAPGMMIGEKGADAILTHWFNQRLVSLPREHLLYLDSNKCYYS